MPIEIQYQSQAPDQSSSRTYRVGLNLAAWATAVLMFPLIFLGGLVTSHQAGMSVPDWPNSYGYNMFLFPPKQWVGGIFYEHTHRLLGSAVGLCAIVLALIAWAPAHRPRGRKWIAGLLILASVLNLLGTAWMALQPDRFHVSAEARPHIASQGLVSEAGLLVCGLIAWSFRRPEPRRHVRWLCLALLLAVCVQGLLGGLRVDLINLSLAIVHGCFAQATFCLLVLILIVTGRRWPRVVPPTDPNSASTYRRLFFLGAAGVGVVYAQLVVGAVMRHYQAGLAIPDLPLMYGRWLPPTTAVQLQAINHHRVWELNLPAVTLGQIWLHAAHRMNAVVVSVTLIGLIVSVFRARATPLKRLAGALSVLLLAQLTLGVLTVYLKKPADVASAHVACGALVLATTFGLSVRAARLASWRSGPVVMPGVADHRLASALAV